MTRENPDFSFASKKPGTYSAPTIDNIFVQEWKIHHVDSKTRTPWKTKSGGYLEVLFHLPWNLVQRVISSTYEPEELANMPEGFDIRGLRGYSVMNIPEDKIGGLEFHRIRHEIIYSLGGEVEWRFEDVYGKMKEILLSGDKVIYFPPLIKHDYWTPKNSGGSLGVFCNTLFNPLDKITQDTYSAEIFEGLKKKFEN